MNKIFDLHNDFLTSINRDNKKTQYLLNKKQKTISNIISSVWTTKMSRENAVKSIRKGFSFIESINRSKCACKPQLGLAIEDMHFVSKECLDEVIAYNPIYCGLTWNYDNVLAGGAHDGGDISMFGIEVIRELESNNIFVDTAHLSEKSFMTFSCLTEKPILCSHTAVHSLVNNNRNLKDYQIRMIAESGGLIGIALVGQFLSNDKKSTISDIARHIDYIVSLYGDKNIALGTDFYGTKNLPKGIKNYSNLKLLEDRLKILGYSEETINNIFYKNAENFFNKNTTI